MEKIIEEFKSRRAKRLDQRFGGNYQKVVEFRKRRAARLDAKKDDEEGRWVTTENNHKVHINEEGEPDKGNPHVIDAMRGEKASPGDDHSAEKRGKIASKMPKGKSCDDYNNEFRRAWESADDWGREDVLEKFLGEVPVGTLIDCDGWMIIKGGENQFYSEMTYAELDWYAVSQNMEFREENPPRFIAITEDRLHRTKIKSLKKELDIQERTASREKSNIDDFDEKIRDAEEENKKLIDSYKEEKEYYSDQLADWPYDKVVSWLDSKKEEKAKIKEKLREYSDKYLAGELTDEDRKERSKLTDKEFEIEDIEDYKKLYEGWEETEKTISENKKKIEGLKERKASAERSLKEAEAEVDKYKSETEKAVSEYGEYAKKRNEETLKRIKTPKDIKTVEDANDYLRAKGYFGEGSFDVDEKVNLEGMETDLAVSTAQHIDGMFRDYPFLKGHAEGVLCLGKKDGFHKYEDRIVYAYASGRKVVFSKDYYGDGSQIKSSFADDVEGRYSPKGVDHNSIVDHEFTHVMEYALNEKLGKKRASDIVMRRVAQRFFNLASPEDVRPEHEYDVRSKVSRYSVENYGTKKDENGNLKYKNYGMNTEFLAEAISEARCSKTPREVAVMAMEEFNKLAKEVFG